MSSGELTVGKIAAAIKRPDEELGAAIDRLHNWTKEGLIQPEGEKNPGRGRKRVYPKSALIDAVILQHLTEVVGTPAVMAARGMRDELRKIRKIFLDPNSINRVIVFGIDPEGWSAGVLKWKDLEKHKYRTKHDTYIIVDMNRLIERHGRAGFEEGDNG